jgi:ankyrin repeat protein
LNLKLVETLLGNGAVANTNDHDGETPLHLCESAAMTELLLKKGKANPNIPNVDGICALHLAVQRRDIDSVRALLRSGASVNNADNIRWFTALHLISLPARNQTDDRAEDDVRSRIAQLLSGSYDANEPDFDYQDSEGNTPLHYAVQLETPDACDLVTIFLEKGADPNICNDRDQSPLHLLCHNEELRNVDVYQEILHAMLFHGADPNLQSMTGCTPMHLSLYHRDIDSAVQLVSHGAELHVLWRKVSVPPRPITTL